MNPRQYAWIAAGVLFAAATVWINYEVKVKLQPGDEDGPVQELGDVHVGQPAPDFSAQDLAGQNVTLAGYRGQKVVVLDFWATWCAPCRMAMPGLQAILEEFKARGLEVLSVNQRESAAVAGAFMGKNHYGFHVLLDPDSAIGAQYGVRGIPTLVAVDRQGVVRWIQVGYSRKDDALKGALEKLMGK